MKHLITNKYFQIALVLFIIVILMGVIDISVADTSNTTDNKIDVTELTFSTEYLSSTKITQLDDNTLGEYVAPPDYNITYYESEKTEYIIARSGLNIRSTPNSSNRDNIVGVMEYGSSITCKGDNGSWCEVIYNDSTAYAYKKYISETEPIVTTYTNTCNSNWSGAVLNRRAGRITGPNGDETYYNLNMSGCVRIMNSLGYYYDTWVRSDGAKMFGDYIMVAADLSKYPKGTIVTTSLGQGIVVDTGSFVNNGSNVTFDIATTW